MRCGGIAGIVVLISPSHVRLCLGACDNAPWLGCTGSRSYPTRSLLEEPVALRSPRSAGTSHYRKCFGVTKQGLAVWGGLQAKIQCAFLFCRRGLSVNCTLEDMVYLSALGQPILVIHGLKAAAELLDRRAHIYSSRPRLIMAHEILTDGLLASFLPYGDA
jgi:hypothetical protein